MVGLSGKPSKKALFSVKYLFQGFSFVSFEEMSMQISISLTSNVEYFSQHLELTVSPKTSTGQEVLPLLLGIFRKG